MTWKFNNVPLLERDLRYTEIMYVSPDGDNSSGDSWSSAYTTLQTAYTNASSDSNSYTLILIASGTYDLNETGWPTWSKNIHVKGVNDVSCIITNTHATASGVVKCTNGVMFENLTILGGNNGTVNIHGINFNGSTSGSKLKRVFVNMATATGAVDGILADGGSAYLEMHDNRIVGNATHVKGVHLNDCNHTLWYDTLINTCNSGLHLDNASDDLNFFYRTEISSCVAGLTIDASVSSTHFECIGLFENTTNISDSGTDTHYSDVCLDSEIVKTAPMTPSTGVTVTSGNGVDVFSGSYDTIIDNISTPFRVVGITFDNLVAADKQIIKLASGAAASEVVFASLSFHGAGAQNNIVVDIKTRWFPANTRISADLATESGGIDDLDLWLEYVETG